MLARVLLVLLAGGPVYRGADSASGASYSQYYEADENNENPAFYNSYEEEIRNDRMPPQMTTDIEDMEGTRLKRNDQSESRTLNPKEIVDVKGVLTDIMQGKQLVSLTRQPARESTESYEYLENSNNLGAADITAMGNEFEKGRTTVEGHILSLADDKQENMVDTVYATATSRQVTEQHWSFVYQPETSTFSKDEIVGEVRDMMPEGMVPQRSTDDFATIENTEETKNSMDFYPQETTTYSNSLMEAVVNNLVHHRGPASTGIVGHLQESTGYSTSEMQADVKKLVEQWIIRAKDPQESTEFSNSEMQADVKKLIQHWSPTGQDPRGSKEDSNTEMQADVKKWVQQWISRDKDPQDTTEYSNSKIQADVKKWVKQWVQQITRVTDSSPEETTEYSNSEMQADVKKLIQHWSPRAQDSSPEETTEYSNSEMQADVKKLIQHWSPRAQDLSPEETTEDSNSEMQSDVKKLIQHWSPRAQDLQESTHTHTQTEVKKWLQQWIPGATDLQESTEYSNSEMQTDVKKWVQQWNSGDTTNSVKEDEEISEHESEVERASERASEPEEPQEDPQGPQGGWQRATELDSSDTFRNVLRDMETTTNTTTTAKIENTTTTTTAKIENTTTTTTVEMNTTTVTTEKSTKSTTRQMDIDAIMAIISNLTYDYEWNLTEQFNKSIIDHGVPTCPWAKWGPGGFWAETTIGTTLPWDFENASVVSKCFVCGLKTPEIPRNAYCADAFAGDFLPLMPIDAKSRSMIANYRRYCRYIDVQNYIENPEEPRSIYGRFTGGCAVRWTDLTGVYTQRTCRSRYRPLLGKHFASKRMAKLELALVNVDEGCIISPMATLLPVSRGISLYARFHACVCTANWCNRSTLETTSTNTVATILLTHWLVNLASG